MRHKIFVSVIVGCLIVNHDVQAQKKVYSLAEIWQKTLEQYPSLSSKEYQLEKQQLNKELVSKERLPEVNVQSQQSYGSYKGVSGAFFPQAGIYNVNGSNKALTGQPASIGNLYTSAVIQWNILQFGKIKTKLKVADAAIQISNAALTQEVFQLQVAAAQQYFAVMQSASLLSVNKADVQRLSDLFELSKAQANAGLRPGADTFLVKSDYYQVRGRVNEQQAKLGTAMLQLGSLIGEDVNRFTIDTSAYAITNSEKELPSANSLSTHPYLEYLKATTNYAGASLDAVKRLPYPSVGLLAGIGTRGSGIGDNGIANNSFSAPWQNSITGYLVGVGLTWNLSSLYQNKVKQKIAEKEIASAHANYEEASVQIKTSYNVAVSNWQQQKEKLSDSRIALEASQQAYELYVTRYESGLINLIELLQIQKTLQAAENIYVQAKAEYWHEMINQTASTGNLSFLSGQLKP
ncbi:MAG: TolC family protein [Ferruginibacter sp.]